MTGSIFIWIKNELQKKVVAHFGPIFSIFSSDNCIVTGAKEKFVAENWKISIEKNEFFVLDVRWVRHER